MSEAMRWGLLCVVLAGCFSEGHVLIYAPSPTLSPQQRVAAFEAYRVGDAAIETITTCNNRGCSTEQRPVLVLRNGLQIRYGEDLLPVLAEDGVSGQAARCAQRLQRRASMWKSVLLAGLVSGVAVGFAGIERDVPTLWLAGATVLAVVGGAGAIGLVINRLEAKHENEVVFESYNIGLAHRLDICSSGWAIVPCEGYVPAPQPAAPPGPPGMVPAAAQP